MVFQSMTVNVRDLCNKGAWYGKIGNQSNKPPYNWEGFEFPSHRDDVKILSINMSAATFDRLSEETLFTNADMTIQFGEDVKTFDIPQSISDKEGNIDNFITIHSHTFIGLEQNEVIDLFLKL